MSDTFFRWVASVLVALASAILVFLDTGELPAPLPEPPVVEAPDTTTPLPPDTRMVQGRFPFLGYGAETFQGCAPVDGGPWTVQLVPVLDSKAAAIEAMSPTADLVVFVYPLGGMHPQPNPAGAWNRSPRRTCIFDAGHTAPETYYLQAEHVRGGVAHYAARGLGFLPVGDSWGSNQYYVECPNDVHVDMLTLAFSENDHVRLTGRVGRGDGPDCSTGTTTLARVVVGPSAGGSGGRGGGPNPEVCDGYTIAWWFGVEDMRRNPAVSCAGRVNVTNVLCFNATDCGRYETHGQINIRGVLSYGGPITRCDRDRGLTWFGPAGEPGGSYYISDVEIHSPLGCDWTVVREPWDPVHSVFHHSETRAPAPFDLAGTDLPNPDPRYRVPPVGGRQLLVGMTNVAGSGWGLSCEGEWTRRGSDLDDTSFSRVERGEHASRPWTGKSEYQSVYGPIETPRGTPCPDEDGNNIPDWIEAGDPGAIMEDGRPLILHRMEGS